MSGCSPPGALANFGEIATVPSIVAAFLPQSGIAEVARVGGPFAKSRRHHVCDDAADISFLRRVVVRACVIARDGHRPRLVPGMQAHQKARCVIDVAARVEHLLDAPEMLTVIAMVDLHAAQIDERRATPPRLLEGRDSLVPAPSKDRFSLYVQGVGLQAALLASFRKTHCVEYADGYVVAVRSTQDFRLTRVDGV